VSHHVVALVELVDGGEPVEEVTPELIARGDQRGEPRPGGDIHGGPRPPAAAGDARLSSLAERGQQDRADLLRGHAQILELPVVATDLSARANFRRSLVPFGQAEITAGSPRSLTGHEFRITIHHSFHER
jgi:hypothetical protein